MITVPRELTAENGAKAALSGEFHETVKIPNDGYCGCGECDFCLEFEDEPEELDQNVPVTWTTIKAIWRKAIAHFIKNPPNYAIPSPEQLLKAAPHACWRKCFDCQQTSFHVDTKTPFVCCPHCKSQDTRLLTNPTETLRAAAGLSDG